MRNFKQLAQQRAGQRVSGFVPAGPNGEGPLTLMSWSPRGVTLGAIGYDTQGQPENYGTGGGSLVAAGRT